MPSDALHAVQGLTRRQRVQQLRDRVTSTRAVRDRLVRDLASKQREVAELTSRQEVLTKVNELYRVLMDRMILTQVKLIEQVVSEGLQTIFSDQNLTFKAELSSKYNKVSVDFYVCSGDPEQGGIKGSPLESFGGGPASIISLILRLLTLLRLKKRKLLLLDETLVAVSDAYVEDTGKLLKKLSETMGIPILMVTHKPAYSDQATVSYQGDLKKGGDGLDAFHVKRLRGGR